MHLRKFTYQWHRKLAILAAIPVLLWSLSGVLHPMMAHWFKPTIAKRFLPPTVIPNHLQILSPAEALAQHETIHHFSLIQINKQWVYLAITPNQTQHFHDANTGETVPNGAKLYAEQLARAYLADDSSPLLRIEKIEHFQETYGYINRLLPVYRVKLDRPDGLETLVDLRTGKLATYDNPFRRTASIAFDWLHRWSFLGDRHSLLRISSITIVSLISLATGVLGILNLILFRKNRNQTFNSSHTTKRARKMTFARRAHRLIGIVSLPFYLMFSLSGLYHVVVKYIPDDSTSWVSQQEYPTAKLTQPIDQALHSLKGSPTGVSLAILKGNAYYRLTSNENHQPLPVKLISATSQGLPPLQDKDYAIALALEFSGYSAESIKETEHITSFRNDYGFIFKRLPVWRISFKEQEYWHYTVDTSDAHMAMRMKPASLIETLSFINLHKLHFLDPIHKTLRHPIGAIAVALISILILFGLSMLRKSKP